MQNNTFLTFFVGQNLIILKTVDSTNRYLKELASNSEPLPEGTVIMAENQFAGKGQQQNTWHTESGKNLTFSVFLKPDFIPLNQHFLLNIYVSVAIHRVLLKYIPRGVSIKWPNDIYYHDKKIGGILIENTIMGNKLRHSIIGIGLNVNQQFFEPAIADRAVSLTQILQQELNLYQLLNEICVQLEQLYIKLKAGEGGAMKKDYIENLYRRGVVAKYLHNGQIFDGIIQGISETGLLVIETQGQILEFGFKEVVFL